MYPLFYRPQSVLQVPRPCSRRCFRLFYLVLMNLGLGLGLGLGLPGHASAEGDSQMLLYYRMDFGAGAKAHRSRGLGLVLQRESPASEPARTFLSEGWGNSLAVRYGGSLEWVRYGNGSSVLRVNGLDYWSGRWVVAGAEGGVEGEAEEPPKRAAVFDWFESLPLGVWIGVGFGTVAAIGVLD